MKVKTERNIKEFILHKINKVFIGFDDNIEVELNNIVDYDIDLDNIEYSTIGVTNFLSNKEIENHFVGNKTKDIIYVRIEAEGIIPHSAELIDVFYNIPCDMKIRRLRFSGDNNGQGNMFIELEGFVR